MGIRSIQSVVSVRSRCSSKNPPHHHLQTIKGSTVWQGKCWWQGKCCVWCSVSATPEIDRDSPLKQQGLKYTAVYSMFLISGEGSNSNHRVDWDAKNGRCILCLCVCPYCYTVALIQFNKHSTCAGCTAWDRNPRSQLLLQLGPLSLSDSVIQKLRSSPLVSLPLLWEIHT